jgi:3-oxoacyl-[acyl-carrier-protein] synthase-3
MKNTKILSLGYYVPGGRLTNAEVLARIRSANEGRIKPEDLELLVYGDGRKFEFLGIETRSIAEEPDNTVLMASKAIDSALGKSGKKIGDIDCLIATGVSNPFREPSLALVLASRLDGFKGDFFDVNDTCNGFMKSTDVASQYLASGKYRNVLVVTSENPYEIGKGLGIDYTIEELSMADNKFSTLLVGCGAVLSLDGPGKSIRHYAEKRETINWGASVLTVPGIGMPGFAPDSISPGVWTDARLVSAQVINDMPGFVQETLSGWDMKLGDFDLFVMHQLGNNVTFATLDKIGLSRELAPVNTFREFGNMASANLPINLALAEERGYLKSGSKALLMSSACGLSYSLTHIEW